MLSADELFPAAFHLCVVLALAVGGARLLRLFLSPIPRTLETVERRRLLTVGRFAPLLTLFGCASIVGFVAIVLWLKTAPHGWWNIFPFLAAYALGFAGAIALLGGITVQSILVDAHRGFALEADTGNLQRDVDAALLFAFGVVALATMGFHWVPTLDWSTATFAEIERRQSIIRVAIYVAALAAIVQAYYAVRDRMPATGKGLTLLMSWGTTALFIIFIAVIKSVLPRDYEIERYLRDRGDPASLLGVDAPLPPTDIWNGEILATVGLSLMATMCVTTLVDMLLRRGVSSIYIPQRSWPGFLFACLALSSTGPFALYVLPQDVSVDWIGNVAVPLVIGMVLVRFLPALWKFGAKGYGYAAKTAAHGLLAQILLLLVLGPLVAALLYAASLLTTLGFVVLLLGGMSALTLGWLRLPGTREPAESISAVFD